MGYANNPDSGGAALKKGILREPISGSHLIIPGAVLPASPMLFMNNLMEPM